MKAANSKITADTTYTELKALVPDVSGQKTPAGKTLISDPNQKALISVKEGSGIVTVYESGFFSYRDDKLRVTARAIHKWLKEPYSDSAAYKLWGNGISLPIPFFIMCGIVWAENLPEEAAQDRADHPLD